MNNFDLSGSMPGHETAKIQRWYTIMLCALSATIISITVIHGITRYKVNGLQLKKKEFDQAQQTLIALQKRIQNLKTQNAAAQSSSGNMAHYLDCIAKHMPSQVRIEKLEYKAQTLQLHAMATNPEDIAAFINNLKHEICFEKNVINTIDHSTKQNGNLMFTVTINLKK